MSSQTTVDRIKRTRIYNGKSRTGCGTCKIRHKKCSEEKPECYVCTSTGRKCDGYKIQNDVKRASPCAASKAENNHSAKAEVTLHLTTPANQLVLIPGTFSERRSLDFFYSRTAPMLTGFIDSEFWAAVLPQLSHTEATIRHAMVAVSMIHENLDDNHGLCKWDESVKCVIVQQHNTAIYHLRNLLLFEKREMTLEVTLICCLLFICLEFLKPNLKAAIVHINSGLKILDVALSSKSTSSVSTRSDLIKDHIIPLFNRLDIQSTTTGYTVQQKSNPNVADQFTRPLYFENLHEARIAVDHIGSSSFRFFQEIYDVVYEPTIQPWIFAKLQEIEVQSHQWYVAFGALSQRSEASHWTSKDKRAWTLLEIHYRAALIQLRTCITPSEMKYDSFISDFNTIVSLSENLVNEASRKTFEGRRSAWFSFDMGIIAPLFFAVQKCRDYGIRQRALNLLWIAPRQEGFWYARWCATLANFSVINEEKHVETLPTGKTVVPEWARIHRAEVDDEILPNPSRSVVNLLSKPNGWYSEWHVQKECIPRVQRTF